MHTHWLMHSHLYAWMQEQEEKNPQVFLASPGKKRKLSAAAKKVVKGRTKAAISTSSPQPLQMEREME